ncbi:MAG TPA: DNA translocase FtsK [Bryobacteraceae bacterium]|nr:DNA translocase FtsK [Bryobacteraceae bacterium]
MKLLSPTPSKRLNEITGILLSSLGLVMLLSLASYHVQDPSWDTAAVSHPLNLIGYPGAYLSDLLFQGFGLAAFLFPILVLALAWKWLRSEPIEAGWAKLCGSALLAPSVCAALSFVPLPLYQGAVHAGGTVGLLVAGYLTDSLNLAGALLATFTAGLVGFYLVSKFSMDRVAEWLARPSAWLRARQDAWNAWREKRRQMAEAKAEAKAEEKARKRSERRAKKPKKEASALEPDLAIAEAEAEPEAEPALPPWQVAAYQEARTLAQEGEAIEEEIPICPVEETPAEPAAQDAWPAPPPAPARPADPQLHPVYHLPSTELLNEPPARNPYDEQELKDTAARIKAKFQEFNVLGNVVQINPGPVVTTFEFKPEAGIKYSRITNLTEDLCLGLQAESILIERIPGRPTVGIEVPNTRREVISLRQMLESDEFAQSNSRLTIPLGKDANGRIRMASLETMPHLLIAGSTGSGKSVMINSMIMSILYKSTPDEVRMIMVDPKRLELGLYEGIPHLLTPVIIDPKKASNALRNAVLEMERRLRLLAEYGVRNIDQFNKKVRKLQDQPRSLFADQDETADDVRPLPYVLILIDELADLMMLERQNVEESVTRLAQMARAVGMHLVLATQRPSVDVITGLIKANFPSRISFRVATRVDSRTVLDVMGAEHLLGKGDMLFLPPGSSRLVRVHGSYVSEGETNDVVDFWKKQAEPEYDQSFLIAPPSGDDEEDEEFDGPEDPMYQEAVRVVCEMGKASTSTLQRRLRLGYGRAARILDMMQRDGIIGPPDGSRPRDVLKRPDWLEEVENQLK